MFIDLFKRFILLISGIFTLIFGPYLGSSVPSLFKEENLFTSTSTLNSVMATTTVKNKVLATSTKQLVVKKPVEQEIIATSTIFEKPDFLVNPISLLEKEIDVKSIVLIRCLFQSQYFKDSVQPWAEQEYNVGSGVIVSPKGYILTARHILEVRPEMLNDPAGRKWTLQRCDAAQTDKDLAEIGSIKFWNQGDDQKFKSAKVIFKTTDDQYRGSAGLDFAFLKIDSNTNFPYMELSKNLLFFDKKTPVIAIGYPGRESVSPQKLERFDAEFIQLTYYDQSLCDGSIKPCGFRYAIRRYPLDYQKDFWKATDLGIITPYFRGGFSGGPVFYKGNLIGIVTHGRSGDQTESGWDEAFILTSYDIAETLKNILEF